MNNMKIPSHTLLFYYSAKVEGTFAQDSVFLFLLCSKSDTVVSFPTKSGNIFPDFILDIIVSRSSNLNIHN